MNHPRTKQGGQGPDKDARGGGGGRGSDPLAQKARLRPIQIFCISEPDTDPNWVGSFGSVRYKDTMVNGKFCMSEPDTDILLVSSFGSARYT